jgi:hypothetical protein
LNRVLLIVTEMPVMSNEEMWQLSSDSGASKDNLRRYRSEKASMVMKLRIVLVKRASFPATPMLEGDLVR